MAEQLDNRVSVTVVCIDADSDGNAASSVAGPVLLGWAGLGNVRQRAAELWKTAAVAVEEEEEEDGGEWRI